MRVYGWVRKTGGVSWYRIQEKLRGLALQGHHVDFGPELRFGDLTQWDVVITSVHGEKEASVGWEAMARLPHRPFMVYDIDDDVWNFREGLHQYEYWQDEELLRNVQSCIACADLVTTPSPVLADVISSLNKNVRVVYNYVPEWLLKLGDIQFRRPAPFTVGYQGGDTHKYDVATIAPELFRFILRHKDARLHIWGAAGYEGLAADRVIVTPWQQCIKQYYVSLAMTVGLAPLERTPFNDAKSAIKAVEYAALGIPCLATSCITYQDTVRDCETGYLLSRPADWYDALEELRDSPDVVRRMGNAAWRRAHSWTTERNAPDYETMLSEAMNG